MEAIPINIWDDFHGDGYVPEGEIQKTYMYVENYDIPHESCRVILDRFKRFIEKNLRLNDVKMWLEFYDSRIKYPNICEKEYPHFHFQRWEIKVENMTHKQIQYILDILDGNKLILDDIPLKIYSESCCYGK
jgi:hypothetical protein